MAHYAYVRVSTVEQQTERQEFKGVHIDKTIEEKASASNTDGRPKLMTLIEFLQSGDVVHVYSIDRLARNLRDLENLIETINDKGCAVQFHKEGLTFSSDSSNPMGKLMLQMMGAFAEFERSLINERTAEGRAKSKAKGIHQGRPSALTKDDVDAIKAELDSGKGVMTIAKERGLARNTVYKIKRGEYKVVEKKAKK